MQGLTENLTRLLLRLVPGASIIAQYVFDKNYEVSIPDRSDWIANNVVLNDEVVCFTDGSRLNKQVVQEQVCSLNHTISNKLYHLDIMLLSFRQKCMLYAFAYRLYATK